MLENERKFLVRKIPNLDGVQQYEIEQGYLSFVPEIRIRKKGSTYFLTHKGEGNQVRTEIETDISLVAYEMLSCLVQEKFIHKTRYEILLDNDLIAELDIYHGNLEGLVTVEVEFKTNKQVEQFIVPNWFGKEITQEKKYKNKNLTKYSSFEELVK